MKLFFILFHQMQLGSWAAAAPCGAGERDGRFLWGLRCVQSRCWCAGKRRRACLLEVPVSAGKTFLGFWKGGLVAGTDSIWCWERWREGEIRVSCMSDAEATRSRLSTTQVSPAELVFAPEDGRCSAVLLVTDKANVLSTDFHLALLLNFHYFCLRRLHYSSP